MDELGVTEEKVPALMADNRIMEMRFLGRRTILILREPIACPRCRTMHYIVTNVEGRTTCCGCAPVEE